MVLYFYDFENKITKKNNYVRLLLKKDENFLIEFLLELLHIYTKNFKAYL